MAPEGKDKIELFDYLTHTMSLEIQHVSYKQEVQLYPYPEMGDVHMKMAKFIEVRAKKNEKE